LRSKYVNQTLWFDAAPRTGGEEDRFLLPRPVRYEVKEGGGSRFIDWEWILFILSVPSRKGNA
jgi:hypothetical protein